MHAELSVSRAADRIVDPIELEVHVSCHVPEYIRHSNKYILPPPRSPILTTSVEKGALSNWPQRLCVGIKYLGALSSSVTSSSHLTGLNSGACKNFLLCVAPATEIIIFAGCRSELSQQTIAYMICEVLAYHNEQCLIGEENRDPAGFGGK